MKPEGMTALADAASWPTARCLEHGAWRPLPSSRVAHNYSAALTASRYMCIERRRALEIEQQAWRPSPKDCPAAARTRLHDPLRDDFDGLFSSAARPVHIALLSDSLGAQLKSSVETAARANPHHLRALRFVDASRRANDAMRPFNLATIPRNAAGCQSVLGSIHWPAGVPVAAGAPSRRHHSSGAAARSSKMGTKGVAMGSASKGLFANGQANGHHANVTSTTTAASTPNGPTRIILASSGMWYNLRPYCNGSGMSLFGLGANATCSHFILGKRIHPADVELNHSSPMSARPQQFWRLYHQQFGVPPWGWYSWARRLRGTATIREYEADVATFLDTALSYAVDVSATLIWVETTPQHFAPLPRSAADPKPTECTSHPATPLARDERWPQELEELCLSAESEPAPPVHERTARAGNTSLGRPRTDCHGDWRNHIARRLAAARGVRVVPLAAALSSRSDLHTGGAGDCTHWCEGSEAHAHLAMAVLNVIRDVLQVRLGS